MNLKKEKDYLSKLQKEAEAELRHINNYLKNHISTNLEDIYTFTNDYRKTLIKPLILPDELYVQQWENESYKTNPYYEKYHEHLGLLDDNDYRYKNLRKLNEYRRSGIYPGKNMIITYEADGSPLNIKDIREMVKEMFFAE